MGYYQRLILGRNNRFAKALGYIDTGNTLVDVQTGKPVAVASPMLMNELLPKELHKLIKSYQSGKYLDYISEEAMSHEHIHLIPYHTICSDNQLMLAFEFDFIISGNKTLSNKPLIGVSRRNIQMMNTDRCVLLNRNYLKKGVYNG